MLPCEGAYALIVFGHDRNYATSGLSPESVCLVRIRACFAELDRWAAATGVSMGAMLRRVSKAGRVKPGPITAQAVFEAVVRYARTAGLGKITPHDLRRTFAKLAHLGRAPLDPIQISLGHASIQTTERNLGLRQNLHDAPCDRLGIKGWEG